MAGEEPALLARLQEKSSRVRTKESLARIRPAEQATGCKDGRVGKDFILKNEDLLADPGERRCKDGRVRGQSPSGSGHLRAQACVAKEDTMDL